MKPPPILEDDYYTINEIVERWLSFPEINISFKECDREKILSIARQYIKSKLLPVELLDPEPYFVDDDLQIFLSRDGKSVGMSEPKGFNGAFGVKGSVLVEFELLEFDCSLDNDSLKVYGTSTLLKIIWMLKDLLLDKKRGSFKTQDQLRICLQDTYSKKRIGKSTIEQVFSDSNKETKDEQ